MGIFDKFKKNKGGDKKIPMPMYLYDDAEINELDKYIAEKFGKFDNVFHELISPDVHLDVCMIPPTEDEPYQKLVTMGAGAYKMAIPDKWKEYDIDHAEYVIYVPKDWNIHSDDIKDYWPTKVLKDTARLPIWCDTWLTYGHSAQADEEGTPYAPNTGFNSVILNYCEKNDDDVRIELSSGKVITFYELVPLYPAELKYKFDNGANALFDLFNEKGIQFKVVDINRPSAV